ncbi:hypothetical protein FOA52_008865 [Chlamydomonas sp. UWO 241]|nr:hypothetical protein FOA52_008865 [Chlamydomonas sp. UWO 241]
MEDFSKLPSERVRSETFEAGICTWKLSVDPDGYGDAEGTHLSVFLEAQDDMWAPSAEFKFTMLNQADASKSLSMGYAMAFNTCDVWGTAEFIELSELKTAGAGWLVNDTLVLTVDVTVQREDRFQLDTGGIPCDVALKLPCGAEVSVHGLFLQVSSLFFCDALEDVSASAPIPVDGSIGTWTYIVSCLYLLHDQPDLTLRSVYTLLPVVHKYDFPKPLTRLMAFIKGKSEMLSHNAWDFITYTIRWLALAERLQLDELRELCLDRMRGMTREQLQMAITVEVEAGSGTAAQKKHAFRSEVKNHRQDLRDKLLTLIAVAS